MLDERGELLKKAKDLLQQSKFSLARELDAPVIRLTPEAREDAQEVAREVWKEGMRLLEGKDESVRRDAQDNAFIISGKSHIDETIFNGADLLFERYFYTYDVEAQAIHRHIELYHFYPGHVLKTTRNSSATYKGEQLVPRGLATEKHEVNRDELGELLRTLRTSKKFKGTEVK